MTLTLPASADFDDASQWLNFGGNPEFDGRVRAMVLDENKNLYCGGDFTSVAGTTANRVVFWDGTSWTSLGQGLNGTVHCLAYSNGILYAGGQFTQAGGRPAINVARWDGANWSALGIGPNGTVYAAAIAGDDVYFGGSFPIVGGVGGQTANNIARWDGENWNTLGSGTNGHVNALLANGNTIIAGGNFTFTNGVAVNRVASWNGTEWTALGIGVNGQVFALARSGANLYVGGEFSRAGGLSAGRRIAKWNGTAWSGLGTGVGLNVYSIATNGEDVFAGMLNSVIRWNRSAWVTLGSGTNGVVRALAIDRLNLKVGGDFTLAGNKPSPYAAEVITDFRAALSVQLPEGISLDEDSIVDYGDIAIDSTNGRYVFTVQNFGNLTLNITNIALTGDDDLDSFVLDTGDALESMAPDDQKTFSVTFLPTEAGEKTVSLEIASNDPVVPVFTLTLTATGADAIDMYFNAMEEAGLEDFDALPDEIAFGDGVENVLKYGFNMNLSGPDSATLQADGESGLPRYGIVEESGNSFFRFEYLRRKGSGLIYTPLKSADLVMPFAAATGTETVQDIDRQWERALFDQPVDLTTDPTCFGRVMVELPFAFDP